MANLKDTLVLGKLTATDSIIGNRFIKSGGLNTDILMGDGSTQRFATNFGSSGYDNILVGTNSSIRSRTKSQFIKDLKLSQVYNYKGTITWDQLTALTYAEVGDVYFISGADGDGLESQSWACTTRVTAATGSNYATYWQSLGNYVDLSGYVTIKNIDQTIDGQKNFLKPITVNYATNTWHNGCGGASAYNVAKAGYSGWIGGYTLNGRMSISTYSANDNKMYFTYMTEATLTAGTNQPDQQMVWDGPTNILSISGLNLISANLIYNTIDKCIDVTFN